MSLVDADTLVAAIFAFRNQQNPDGDPGDLTIVVQDDMPLVTVDQDGWTDDRCESLLPSFGATITEALGNHLRRLHAAAEGKLCGSSQSNRTVQDDEET